jgi:hypothetical protein
MGIQVYEGKGKDNQRVIVVCCMDFDLESDVGCDKLILLSPSTTDNMVLDGLVVERRITLRVEAPGKSHLFEDQVLGRKRYIESSRTWGLWFDK